MLTFSQSINLIDFNSSDSYAPGSGVSVHINPTGIFELSANSYDFNLSKIGGDGGISEFSITYDFLNNKDCFGCPEY